jgi:AbrB family looped-hinge helix DNA binding protein
VIHKLVNCDSAGRGFLAPVDLAAEGVSVHPLSQRVAIGGLDLRAGHANNVSVSDVPTIWQGGFHQQGRSRMPRTKKAGTELPHYSRAKKTKAFGDAPIALEPSRVGKRGTVVIPAALRRRYGIEEGTLIIAEPREGGVLIRPAVVLPIEVYTPERKAQFLLSNAVDAADYAGAVAAVRAMGLDPNAIPHYKPSKA